MSAISAEANKVVRGGTAISRRGPIGAFGVRTKMPAQNESQIKILVESRLPTVFGKFRMLVFTDAGSKEEHIALINGPLDSAPIVRVHSECQTGDLFGSLRCDCGSQLLSSMQLIGAARNGILVYLRQEGRGIGLISKLRAYNLQDDGLNTLDANLALGLPADGRSYAAAFGFLRSIGVSSIKLISNNPVKISAAAEHGIEVLERIEVPSPVGPENEDYIRTKKLLMGHRLNEKSDPAPSIKYVDASIPVARLENAVEWYCRVFGFMVIDTCEGRYVRLGSGHIRITLEAQNVSTTAPAEAGKKKAYAARLEVESLSQFLGRCRRLGVAVAAGPHRTDNGRLTAAVVDEDGNELAVEQKDAERDAIATR